MSFNTLGKKVFFIYPHSVIQNQLIQELIDREYEVYFVNAHNKVESICELYRSPVLFINIDEGQDEPKWEKLVKDLMGKESTSHTMIGIVTYNENSSLAQKYLMEIMVPCGFIVLKLGMNDSTNIIIKTLEANEVKGKRKYVRAKCSHDKATFNVQHNGALCEGNIIDISSVGIAVNFKNEPALGKNTYLRDIQLKLRGILVRVSAVVMGYRKGENEKTLYVLLFDQNVSKKIKSKLRSYINRTLQQEMEKKLQLK